MLNFVDIYLSLLYIKEKRKIDSTYKFKINDKVRKVTGDYQLDGVVVSVFKTLAGKVRLVVEHEPGFLHIYNENQLTHISEEE